MLRRRAANRHASRPAAGDHRIDHRYTEIAIRRPATFGIREASGPIHPPVETSIASSVPADARWHHLLVSHYTARGESLFFVDGILAGRAAERSRRPVRDRRARSRRDGWTSRMSLIYRSALNADEAATLAKGTLASGQPGDLFAARRSPIRRRASRVENRAQSLSELKLEAGAALPGVR